MMIQLENEVVCLRALTMDDVDALCEVAFYPEIWMYMSQALETRADVVAFIEKALQQKESGTEYPFVIIDKQTNKIVGSTRFMDIDLFHRRLEIGTTWHTPAVWRTHINTNCKLLLLTHCFDILEVRRVQIKTDAQNARSRAAIERIGAQFEGILRQHMTKKDGTARNTAMFSVTWEDWPDVAPQLEALASR
ncbi:MAG: GNAT family protein [Solibacillus sp.]